MAYLFEEDKGKIPVDSDIQNQVDALGGLKFMKRSIPAGDRVSFFLDAGTRATIITQSANGAANGIINVNVDSSGWVMTTKLVGASNIPTTHAITGNLIVQNPTSSYLLLAIFIYAGEIEE